MNFETTLVSKVFTTPDDDIYLEIEGLTRERIVGSTELQNLSKRQVIGNLFFVRSLHFSSLKPDDLKIKSRYVENEVYDLSRARYLSPGDPAIQTLHDKVLGYYGVTPEHTSFHAELSK